VSGEEGATPSPGKEQDVAAAARRVPDRGGAERWAGERPSDLVEGRFLNYRARELGPYGRRDAGLYDVGLTGRYPGLRGSGARDPRITSTGPGPGAGTDQQPDRASMLIGRIALVATIVVGQLWGLTEVLNAWIEHRMDQVWLLLAFEAASVAVALALWLATSRDR
jgi:hypothetical protein